MNNLRLTNDELQMLLDSLESVGWGAGYGPHDRQAKERMKAYQKLRGKLIAAMEEPMLKERT